MADRAPRYMRTTGLRRLERIRRRIPYAYWLLYDVVIGATLWAAYASGWRWALIGAAFLAVAVFFDVVEFIVKGMESKLWFRLFEGTGDPS